jgi:hypothetical protein
MIQGWLGLHDMSSIRFKARFASVLPGLQQATVEEELEACSF